MDISLTKAFFFFALNLVINSQLVSSENLNAQYLHISEYFKEELIGMYEFILV